MVLLICKNCTYKWDYTGINEYYATCPQCRYKVKISKDKAATVHKKKLKHKAEDTYSKVKKPQKLHGIARMVNTIIEEHNYEKNMLIQILLMLQNSFRWLPKEVLMEVSKQLEVPYSSVYQIALFYKAFSVAPRGRHLIQVCNGTSCNVRGAELILDRIKQSLNIERNETTADGKFTLETVNCIGCCALGPVMTIDGVPYGNLKISETDTILSRYG